MTPYEIIAWIEKSTPNELREAAQIISHLSASPRNADWIATCRMARAKFPKPAVDDRAQAIAWNRSISAKREAELAGQGLSHRQLVEAELARRGDQRTFDQVVSEVESTARETAGLRTQFAQ